MSDDCPADRSTSGLGPVWSIAAKDLRLLSRDRYGLFWILVFPLFFALFFGFISSPRSGGRSRAKVLVVDRDGSPESAEYLAKLKASDAIDAVAGDDVAAAAEAVRTRDAAAYLELPEGFGRSMGIGAGAKPPLVLGVDPSQQAAAGLLQGVVMENYFAVARRQFSDLEQVRRSIDAMRLSAAVGVGMDADQRQALGKLVESIDGVLAATPDDRDGDLGGAGPMAPPQLTVAPIAAERADGPRSAFEVTFPSGILWGVLGCIATFAVAIVAERNAGTLFRLRVAPVTYTQILAGKGLACFLTTVAIAALLMLVGMAGFGVRVVNRAQLPLAILCVAFCFTGVMMSFSVFGRSERAVSGGGWGVMILLAMLGGAMIPVAAMPQWLARASVLSPVMWGIYALEGGVWRDLPWGEFVRACVVLLSVGGACLTLGVAVLRHAD